MDSPESLDAVVVGAGFSGIYQLQSLRSNGYRVKLIEMAPDVGGTWFWNKYPGATSDTESHLYRYSWDKQSLMTHPWTHYFLKQAEILAYLRSVVDRHDLRKDMYLNTEMISAEFDEVSNVWRVQTSQGVLTARYLVTGLGLLSKPKYPDIKGLSTFNGDIYHTARFPGSWDFSEKRVAVIGNGSTGIQAIVELGKPGQVKTLTSFQRHPQYSVPNGDGPLPPTYRATLNANWDKVWESVKSSRTGYGFAESTVPALSVTAEERERVYEEVWDRGGGGFRFMFQTFSDLTIDAAANETAANFIRRKIVKTVRDPEKARKLTPHDYYARRPACDNGYYDTFNNDHVDIVDLRDAPITEITERGILTADGKEHLLDVILFATGFDAVDGNYRSLKIRGRGGKLLNEHWSAGPTSYLGISVADFPNFFMLMGPYCAFGNNPPIIEMAVELTTACIRHAQPPGTKSADGKTFEATAEAEKEWVAMCDSMTEGTLFTKIGSWFNGGNIKNKKHGLPFYMLGIDAYSKKVAEITSEPEWLGFRIS
ncbi:hypothetical protein DL95DRAFT_397725 [Leptodontidium sp. 2 PMI_412]|nr:hypothetical protein DL95DRAFT_397725 [Leptodontidium sp. 2 PMI_412]